MKKLLTKLFTRGQPDTEDIKRSLEYDTSTGQVSGGSTPGVVVVQGSRAGEVRTETLAMKIAAYYRAVKILSETVACLPLDHLRSREGVFVKAEDSIQYLLNMRPNADFSAFDLKREIVARTMNQGEVIIIPRSEMGEVYELVLVNKGAWAYDKNRRVYLINDWQNGISGEFHPFEVIHIRNIGLDGGYTGLSTIRYAARILGIAQAADEQSLETFEGGSMIKGMVSGEGSGLRGMGAAVESQLETIANRVDTELRSGKNIIELPANTKFSPLQMTVAEAKLLEHREFSVLEIARFTGVPPDKLYVNNTVNYKASEMSQINFLNDSIAPILTQIEQEFSEKLLGRHLAFSERIQFNRRALLNTDVTALADYYAKMHGVGSMTTNEIRAEQGLLPVDGGDQALVSTNLQLLNAIKVKEDGRIENPKS